MKFFFKPNRITVLAIISFATVPATIYALISDDFIQIVNQASIGLNFFGNDGSNRGVLLVGEGNTRANYQEYGMVVGKYNILNNTGSAVIGEWNKNTNTTQELLILGNGIYNGWDPVTSTPVGIPSNAMEVLKNGRTKLINKAWKANVGFPLADPPLDPYILDDGGGDALVVEGHTRLLGKVVIEQPQGDIPMFSGN